jgi:transcriptional regulator with XRE-family HTH domain
MELKIREMRKAAGWKKAGDFAVFAKVSPRTLSGLETGRGPKPTMGTLDKIARAIGCEVKDLFRDPENADKAEQQAIAE